MATETTRTDTRASNSFLDLTLDLQKKVKDNTAVAFCDGSFTPLNNGNGYGCLVFYKDNKSDIINSMEFSGRVKKVAKGKSSETKDLAEGCAVLDCIKWARKNNTDILIHTDSDIVLEKINVSISSIDEISTICRDEKKEFHVSRSVKFPCVPAEKKEVSCFIDFFEQFKEEIKGINVVLKNVKSGSNRHHNYCHNIAIETAKSFSTKTRKIIQTHGVSSDSTALVESGENEKNISSINMGIFKKRLKLLFPRYNEEIKVFVIIHSTPKYHYIFIFNECQKKNGEYDIFTMKKLKTQNFACPYKKKNPVCPLYYCKYIKEINSILNKLPKEAKEKTVILPFGASDSFCSKQMTDLNVSYCKDIKKQKAELFEIAMNCLNETNEKIILENDVLLDIKEVKKSNSTERTANMALGKWFKFSKKPKNANPENISNNIPVIKEEDEEDVLFKEDECIEKEQDIFIDEQIKITETKISKNIEADASEEIFSDDEDINMEQAEATGHIHIEHEEELGEIRPREAILIIEEENVVLSDEVSVVDKVTEAESIEKIKVLVVKAKQQEQLKKQSQLLDEVKLSTQTNSGKTDKVQPNLPDKIKITEDYQHHNSDVKTNSREIKVAVAPVGKVKRKVIAIPQKVDKTEIVNKNEKTSLFFSKELLKKVLQ